MKKLLLLAALAATVNPLGAQSLEQAKRWFAEGKYAEAKPVFEKLVTQAPNNASYHYWFGVCAYKTGDAATAESYLDTGVKRRIAEAYPYLAELYMDSYRFADALRLYSEYADILAKKKENIEHVRQRMELAEKAQRMTDRVEDIQIIDSTVVDKDSFLAAYILSDEAGALTSFRDFFKTQEEVLSSVHANELGDKIYYAHPTQDNPLYRIYTQAKLIDKWEDEKALPANVNVEGANVNYPFVLSDGLTIYYACDGNGSIGGYDLFVTRYNTSSDAWLTPEQLGMPFNSFANDYMLVIDEEKNLGWFASDRNQPQGKVCIYLFIPDEARKRVDEADPAVKRSRAMITAIADTRKQSANYAALVKLARTRVVKQEEKKRDFDFVINNNLTYHSLQDIKSPEARSLYEKYISTARRIDDLERNLSALRNDYAKGNPTKKSELSPAILQAEKQLLDLLAQPPDLEKKARNAEINHLLKLNR
ncbi:MAG: tetratricopeptide repeat protein [Tannerellaceae bacterium]|jgi:thioredoxin-like negative regulator of GroEL|nr:tetratricopeptide repeat protein [Tannerellaceae bacterium]